MATSITTGPAKGGERIREKGLPATTVPDCQFPGYPGTVSWKIGYQLYRDGPVHDDGSECRRSTREPTGGCRRRFDQERMNFFHYILYAHYRGKPESTYPCLDATGQEVMYPDTTARPLTCGPLATNPNFHIPSTSSGVADLPGADAMVTLGAWGNNFTGSDFVQASTTMHELGHTFALTHGGVEAKHGRTQLQAELLEHHELPVPDWADYGTRTGRRI